MLDGQFTDELLEKAIAGDSSAFGLLYDTYQPALYRFVYLKVGHREEAEDLTHQAFLSAWEHIGSFKKQGLPISSWLYRIARNKVTDHYRTTHTTFSLEDVERELATSSEDLAKVFDSTQDIHRLQSALRSLHPDQQDVLILRFVEGLSHNETAHALHKNAGTIRVLQYRALQNLKQQLRSENDHA